MGKENGIYTMLKGVEKNLSTLIEKTNNNEIDVLANCMLALTDLVKELLNKGE